MKFYARCGWTPHPAPALVLNVSLCNDTDLSATSDDGEAYRLLHAEDIKELCDRDVSALIEEREHTKVNKHHSILTVLPTHDLICWQHARAEFIGLKIHSKTPHNKGVIHSSDAWIYWTHDFRKQQLFIQRVRTFIEDNENRHNVLAKLLLYAIREARLWSLPRMIVWETGPDMQKAVYILKSRIGGLESILEAQRRETISVRWRGGEMREYTVAPNEHYAWN
jgi:hypothetical protein